MQENIEEYLKQLLSVHWLRPETALWRVFDCLLLNSVKMNGKSIDLGCGDGILSYIMAGGKLKQYDVFKSTENLVNYNKGSDIYNVVTKDKINIDDENLKYTFSYGVDHKDGLISKAKLLNGFYKNTLVHDLNYKLPLNEGSFDIAFSNVLYWLDDLDSVLSEWRRLLKPSGKLILFVPNDNFKQKAWFYYMAPHSDERRKYYNFFDRGYNELIHHCYSSTTWKEIFSRNGFTVVQHQAYLTNVVMDIWNIGTRPIAPLLINMANKLSNEERNEIKEEWIEYFSKFLTPIIEGEFNRQNNESDCAFHFFVLER